MYPWIRLALVITRALGHERLAVPNGVSRLSMRVWPNDLDFNIHMNNARYFALMDLGRLDLMLRAGFARAAVARRWMPVLSGAKIRFRRPLAPFERFWLDTRIVGWSTHGFEMEQTFVIATGSRVGEVAAEATTFAVILQRGRQPRKVTVAEVFAFLNLAGGPQAPPDATVDAPSMTE